MHLSLCCPWGFGRMKGNRDEKEGGNMHAKEKVIAVLQWCWGLVPLLVVLLCVALVAAIQALTGCTLRSVPRMVLMGMGVCSIGVALLWANFRLIFAYIPFRVFGVLVKIAALILSGVLMFYVCLMSFAVMVFFYCPEHVVMYRGTKTVASVDSFLEIYVTYYQYENALFYGKRMAEEWHGSGGHDPFEDTEHPVPKTWTIYDEEGTVVEKGP